MDGLSMWRRIAAAFVLIAAGLAQTPRSTTGSVEGIVLDGERKPLAGATVFIGTLAKGPRTRTDAEGKFVLRDVPIGNVGLDAYKESDGYPYNMFSFFLIPGQHLPKFDVIAGETVKNVVIHLGPKAACLRLQITDESGHPINASLSFSRPDLGQRGDYRRSTEANDVILVPPVPFRFTVEATGFQPWHYGAERWQDGNGLITLKSGETRTLAVRLRKTE
jgi:hypothetical protein